MTERETAMDDQKQLCDDRLGKDLEFRSWMWKTLCEGFFQRYVPEDICVVDIGAGCCGFINNIRCAKKIAVDKSPETVKFAAKGVEVVTCDATDVGALKDSAADVVFISDFFEHISKEEMLKVISEARRILRPGGRLMVMHPNIRYCYRDYWMIFDHVTPLDDRGVCEALDASGFDVEECRPRFLPYTAKGKSRPFAFLLKMYLNSSLAQRIFGKQAFIVAKRRG